MSWHKISITLQQNVSGVAFKIQDSLNPFWMSLANDPEAALFSAVREDCGVDLWISPKLSKVAQKILVELDAKPCDKPEPAALEIGTLLGQKGISFSRLLAR